MKGDTISRSALEKDIRKYADEVGCNRGEYELANGILKALICVENAPEVTAVPMVHRELTDIYVRDKSDGSIHRVGDDCHDSLDVRDGIVSYYNLQNGEGTGEHGDYEFVDSMWGEMDGGEGE